MMHNRGYRRYTKVKTRRKRLLLAKDIGIMHSGVLWDDRHINRLANNGWSCNCWLCKPYRNSNRAVIKRDLIDRIYNEETKDEF
jgi:hypothetical protein